MSAGTSPTDGGAASVGTAGVGRPSVGTGWSSVGVGPSVGTPGVDGPPGRSSVVQAASSSALSRKTIARMARMLATVRRARWRGMLSP